MTFTLLKLFERPKHIMSPLPWLFLHTWCVQTKFSVDTNADVVNLEKNVQIYCIKKEGAWMEIYYWKETLQYHYVLDCCPFDFIVCYCRVSFLFIKNTHPIPPHIALFFFSTKMFFCSYCMYHLPLWVEKHGFDNSFKPVTEHILIFLVPVGWSCSKVSSVEVRQH